MEAVSGGGLIDASILREYCILWELSAGLGRRCFMLCGTSVSVLSAPGPCLLRAY